MVLRGEGTSRPAAALVRGRIGRRRNIFIVFSRICAMAAGGGIVFCSWAPADSRGEIGKQLTCCSDHPSAPSSHTKRKVKTSGSGGSSSVMSLPQRVISFAEKLGVFAKTVKSRIKKGNLICKCAIPPSPPSFLNAELPEEAEEKKSLPCCRNNVNCWIHPSWALQICLDVARCVGARSILAFPKDKAELLSESWGKGLTAFERHLEYAQKQMKKIKEHQQEHIPAETEARIKLAENQLQECSQWLARIKSERSAPPHYEPPESPDTSDESSPPCQSSCEEKREKNTRYRNMSKYLENPLAAYFTLLHMEVDRFKSSPDARGAIELGQIFRASVRALRTLNDGNSWVLWEAKVRELERWVGTCVEEQPELRPALPLIDTFTDDPSECGVDQKDFTWDIYALARNFPTLTPEEQAASTLGFLTRAFEWLTIEFLLPDLRPEFERLKAECETLRAEGQGTVAKSETEAVDLIAASLETLRSLYWDAFLDE